MNEYATAYALLAYAYNRSNGHMARELFPGAHFNYIGQWEERLAEGLPSAMGCMDQDTFRRFVDNAIRAYGSHALERYPEGPASRKPQNALGARIVSDDPEVKSDEIAPQAQAEAP